MREGPSESTFRCRFQTTFRCCNQKLWNITSSGTYFLKAVEDVKIPRKNGNKRLLGITTTEYRIAQMIVRMELEPKVEVCKRESGHLKVE
ncbi:hypothetical protein [Clostridium sp. UBA1056]|uniref:hypothetical protein n=1 Tax=Clostridium sp. UBA1056 TaxID=1946346 RepID=UPI0032175737